MLPLVIMPVFWKVDQGELGIKWGYGYWTGPDSDLLCIQKDCKTNYTASIFLSPICNSWFEAVIAFILKKLLSKIDGNMQI